MKQERTKQKIQSLSRYIIEKAECDSYRAGMRSKQWHIEADQKLLDAVGGRSVLSDRLASWKNLPVCPVKL